MTIVGRRSAGPYIAGFCQDRLSVWYGVFSLQYVLRATAQKYRDAHAALIALSKHLDKVGWQNSLRPLQDDDIKPATFNRLETTSTTEGRKRLTWIWITTSESEDNDEREQDALRVEWCKARARTMRWTEEVELLFEEKRRILQFFEWQTQWWMARADADWIQDPIIKAGSIAYAHRQASLRRKLAHHFENMWKDTQQFLDMANGNTTLA
ncbi:hypothetical protein BJ138DRAFT_1120622 [Hygrophoropsis aurantiaca]|uniref:Uncharacterized protein n=1 Tax=Hygrophoropsis aurantiaca TaxID=72124 RepID=A0ACB7ZQT1_9AGAM|nr:hypothetical protein BJ138DRAFT_1120622 [Hygrophoropsis aurantiaca]